VVHNNNGSFEIGVGGGGATVSSGSGTFTATFTSPVALASEVFKITVESGAHTIFNYSVGDIGPGGGIIIYSVSAYNHEPFSCGPSFSATGSPTGGKCRYLEAAPITGSNAWTDTRYAWSPNTNTEIGSSAQGTALGTGYRNSEAMIWHSGGISFSRAALGARGYRGPNNLTDWYLPSRSEMYFLIIRNDMGIMYERGYWTSSEESAGLAYSYFQYSSQGTYKDTLYYVRPIRAF
jgi:hypothetical protein